MAFDVGFRVTGWCLFINGAPHELGEIRWLTDRAKRKRRMHQGDEDAEACRKLARDTWALFKEHKPHAIVAELPHGGSKSARAGRGMGLASGVLIAAAEAFELPAVYVMPEEVKAITNRFKATKEDVARAVRKAFPERSAMFAGVSDHVTDAAAAYVAGRSHPFIRAVESNAK
jgi:Holliday junction resolvasome RuvABC endonuclease subunit